MGKSSPSPPPPPDYRGAAVEQGAANEAVARLQGRMNNPNIYGPLGSQTVTWGSPTNENADQATVTQNLTPAAQATLDAQQNVQRGLANLGTQGLTQASGILGQPFQPNVPGLQTSISQPVVQDAPTAGAYGLAGGGPGAPQLQQAVGGYGSVAAGPNLGLYGQAGGVGAGSALQSGINTSGLAAMPVSAGMTGQQAITSRLEPDIVREQAALQNRLINQGLRPGGEAYGAEMDISNRAATDRRLQAAAQGIGLDLAAQQQGFGQAAQQAGLYNQAMQNQFGMGVTGQQLANQAIGQNQQAALQQQAAINAAQGQIYNQALGAGQFGNQAALARFGAGQSAQQAANQAIGQNFGQGLQAQGAQNAAAAQRFNEGLQGAQFGNTAQQQALAQQLMLYQQPLNQITALMSGSQMQMPQFQGYQGSSVAPPPLFGAAQATGQGAMDQYGIQSANVNAANAGMYAMLGAGASAYF